MKKNILSFTFFLIILLGCNNNSVNYQATDKIIFGGFAGFVMSDIYSHIYKFENNVLYKDVNHKYVNYNREYSAKWEKMDDSLKVYINKVLLEYPSNIFNEKDTVFGMPDAYDQGGVYLQIFKSDGTSRFWLFDNNTKDIPQYLRDYIENIKEIVWKFRDY